jgi:hypothetical protein
VTQKQLIDDDAAQYASILERLRRLEQGIPEDPHFVGAAGEPAFQNSWTNFDAAVGPAGRSAFFYRYNGRVYLGGLIKTGANNTVAFTLPDGYWPLLQGAAVSPVIASGGTAFVSISPVGAVTPVNQTGSAVTTFCYLEGVSFRHA